MKKIYVDADACPVKEEIIKVASRHSINVLMVCNGGVRPFKNHLVKLVIVPEGPDIADKWIYKKQMKPPNASKKFLEISKRPEYLAYSHR